MRRTFLRTRWIAVQLLSLSVLLLAKPGWGAVVVDLDLDPATPGVQDSLLVAPGAAVTAAVVITVDAGGLSSYAVSAEFDSLELDLAASPAATELLPAGFDANITPGVESETEDVGGGVGQVLTFEAVAFGLGPASTQFTAGTIQFTAPNPTDGGPYDVESGAFNLSVDGAFDNSGLPVTLGFGGAFIHALICGDGVAEGPEQCDDGGTAGLDGCSQTCRLESSYLFSGTAEGGSIDLVIDGFSLNFVTTAGWSAAQVAAGLAAAINADPALSSLGAVGTADGDALVVAGDLESVSITDPGLIAPVPVGDWTATAILLGLWLLASRLLMPRPRQHGP